MSGEGATTAVMTRFASLSPNKKPKDPGAGPQDLSAEGWVISKLYYVEC